MSATLELWDYRRRVHDMYRRVRERGPGPESWAQWVSERDDLFATHPQSPIEDRTRFEGLPYFPYDPSWSTTGRFLPIDDESETVAHSGEGVTRFVKIGFVEFEVAGNPGRLEVLWLDAYGGGLFLPFRDAGNGVSTYGAGGTCSTRSRAPTSGTAETRSPSTSTSPTTRPASTPSSGRAPSPLRQTDCRSQWRPASGSRRNLRP